MHMTPGIKLLVIQPWFSAIGHPAQSLLNMASAFGNDERVDYLVSFSEESEFCRNALEWLRVWGEVASFSVTTPTGASNTIRALLALWRMRRRNYQRIFFFDESLFTIALLWPVFSLWLPVERISVLHLFGPKMGKQNWLERRVVNQFLRRSDVRLYLRTEELAQAWRDSYSSAADEVIRWLPSLEIPDEHPRFTRNESADAISFGIIGQIRAGKGIEWLVPAFRSGAALGRLTIAGEFANPQSREQLAVLQGYEGFVSGFLSEYELLERAATQDYLLMLYDVWDGRMESAVLYLAARVNRPVVVYGDSWCGRMVREFGCGAVAPAGHDETLDLLRRLPRPGTPEYAGLLNGMEAFRSAHSVSSLRGKVLQELLG
jgi:hypothetical protein